MLATEFDRMDFWDKGWQKRCQELRSLDQEGVLGVRTKYLHEMQCEGYPSVRDITPEIARDKVLLNIGCGGGFEGLLFAGYGTRYIGVDFSHNAVRIPRDLTQLAGFETSVYQAHAENLPIRGTSIDIVYTNGVLHHTPNTKDAVREIHRILDPNGVAYIGLYATHSIMFYWYRLHAILRGNFSKRGVQDWLNANTEGEWQTDERVNTLTRTYTRKEFKTLLREAGFADIRLRQTPLQLRDIPIIGQILLKLGLASIAKRRIGPFGGILMATCKKQ